MGAARAKRVVISLRRVGWSAASAGRVAETPHWRAEEEILRRDDGGIGGEEAAGRAGEAMAFELGHGGAELLAGEEAAELGVVRRAGGGGWRGAARGAGM